MIIVDENWIILIKLIIIDENRMKLMTNDESWRKLMQIDENSYKTKFNEYKK